MTPLPLRSMSCLLLGMTIIRLCPGPCTRVDQSGEEAHRNHFNYQKMSIHFSVAWFTALQATSLINHEFGHTVGLADPIEDATPPLGPFDDWRYCQVRDAFNQLVWIKSVMHNEFKCPVPGALNLVFPSGLDFTDAGAIGNID